MRLNYASYFFVRNLRTSLVLTLFKTLQTTTMNFISYMVYDVLITLFKMMKTNVNKKLWCMVYVVLSWNLYVCQTGGLCVYLYIDKENRRSACRTHGCARLRSLPVVVPGASPPHSRHALQVHNYLLIIIP